MIIPVWFWIYVVGLVLSFLFIMLVDRSEWEGSAMWLSCIVWPIFWFVALCLVAVCAWEYSRNRYKAFMNKNKKVKND